MRIQAASIAVENWGGSAAKRIPRNCQKSPLIIGADDTTVAFISESDILGSRKKAKTDYEERVAPIARGREGREKFGSMKGKRDTE